MFNPQQPQSQPQQPITSLKRRFDDFCANVRKRSFEIANEDDSSEPVVIGGNRGSQRGGARCPIRRKRFRRAKEIVESAVADSLCGLSNEEAAFMNTPEYLDMMRKIEEEILKELNCRHETEEDLLRAYEESLSHEICELTSVVCPMCRSAYLSENPGVWIQCTGCGLCLTINDPALNADYLGRMTQQSYENHSRKCVSEPVIKLSPDGRCLVFCCGACNEYTILI